MGRPSLHSQHEQLLPTKQLRAVVLKMHEALPGSAPRGTRRTPCARTGLYFFSRLDTDGSGRLDYWEFRRALIDVLEISITEKEAKGLWAYVDHDKSGLVSIKEFQHACYLLILDDWPALTGEHARDCGHHQRRGRPRIFEGGRRYLVGQLVQDLRPLRHG